MALLGQLKRRLGRAGSAHDESDLRGNDILLEMARNKGSVRPKADKGLEEMANRSLEDSYAPETIDVGSIRPLSKPQAQPPRPEEPTVPSVGGDVQLELEIADRLRQHPPFGKKVDLGKVGDNEWQRVLEGYLVPWVGRREGLASFEELEERLERASLDFSSEISQRLKESLHLSFASVEKDLFAVDSATGQNSRDVIDKAASYFYQEGISYPLKDLVFWIEKEFALSWEDVSNAFIEKCLSLSSRFTIYRHPSAELYVRMS